MRVTVRLLRESELPEADRIFRLAFGTFLRLPDPTTFAGDADYVGTRWRADPEAAVAAEADGALVGSNFATRWGTFGFFGPLTVRPDLWDKGIARRLLDATMDIFARWRTEQAALFTFPASEKHVGLYQKYGFWPQYLTPVMAKPVVIRNAPQASSTWSSIAPRERESCGAECRDLADAIFPGLDLRREIESVERQRLGDTLLLRDGGRLAAFAVCHEGKGSEAGSGSCYVKFGAARPGPTAAQHLDRLLDACEAFAAERGASKLVAGVNAGRLDAYRLLLERGFRTFLQGVAMQRPHAPGFNRPDCFVLDDWR